MEISPKSVVQSYVRHHYGNLISVGEPEFDKSEKQWVAELLSDYPRIIHDDRHPNDRTLKFLSLRRLGFVRVGANLATSSITATSRDDCVDNLTSYLRMWQARADRIIIRASSDNLARTNSAQVFLGKIGTIVSRLRSKDMIFDSEIDAFPPKEAARMRRYLELLEGLEIVSHKDKGYSYGNMYTQLCSGVKDSTELSTVILSHIIKERYSALKEAFGISQLEPVAHVDSLYYRPAIQADELMYWKFDSFERSCKMFYPNRSKICFRLPFILDELVNVQALKFEDNLYFGNDALWKEIRKEADMNEFSLPRG